MPADRLSLFALNASRACGERVAAGLGLALAPHEERDFEDGEHKSRPLVSVREQDVYVIQSLYGDPQQTVNDKLCRLLFFLGALRDAGAARVTVVTPYLCYARKDRKTQPRDPVTTRYLAALFESMDVDRLVAVEVHNPAAFQNAFRCRTEHLDTARLFADWFSSRVGDDALAVVSPDVGGAKRAERLRQMLSRRLEREVAGAFVEKYRAAGVVSGSALVGDVTGRTAIIFDDLVSTGGTLLRAARACRAAGARHVWCAAAHGLFVGAAQSVLADPALDLMVVTDTIPAFRLDTGALGARFAQISTAPLLAEVIGRLHTGGSLVELLELP